jgi:diacylglycerol kinase
MFYPLILLCAFFLFLKTWEWFALLSSGGLVLCTELLNTATERLADALDDYCKREHRENCFTAIRSAKDTAAAASLVSFTILLMVIAIIFFPRLLLIFTA